jgi:oleate hydratase
MVIARQPHFPNQPEGYGLYPDRKGDYIKKTMAECTGAEMPEELHKQYNPAVENFF